MRSASDAANLFQAGHGQPSAEAGHGMLRNAALPNISF